MDTEKQKNVQDASRWLRIGVLSLTVLGPIINTIIARLNEQARIMREASMKQGLTLADGQEKLQAVSTTITDALSDLKEHPYTQEVLKRSSDLTEQSSKLLGRGTGIARDLAGRSTDATRELTQRGTQATLALAERSTEVARELADRSSDVSQELLKRSNKVAKQVSKSGERVAKQVTQNISEQPGVFWTVLGFSVGLTAAGVAAYFLIRKRIQDKAVENQSYQLAQNGHLNGGTNTPKVQPTNSARTATPQAPTGPQAQPVQPTQASVAIADVAQQAEPIVANAATKQEHPTDAAFLGVASTKRYYPVETPLDQLETPNDTPLDVIYFSSEEEAKAQGFTAAE